MIVNSMDTYISIEGLTKNFDKTCAVAEINLTIKQNEMFGLLGSSGCGKSTLNRPDGLYIDTGISIRSIQ